MCFITRDFSQNPFMLLLQGKWLQNKDKPTPFYERPYSKDTEVMQLFCLFVGNILSLLYNPKGPGAFLSAQTTLRQLLKNKWTLVFLDLQAVIVKCDLMFSLKGIEWMCNMKIKTATKITGEQRRQTSRHVDIR